MPTAYDEGPFQNFTAVSWPSDPLVMGLPLDISNLQVHWSKTESGGTDRPLSKLQKLWPLGSQGSGPYNFASIPENTLWKDSQGSALFHADSFSGVTDPFMTIGPLYLENGNLLTNADRPARTYMLSRGLLTSTKRYEGSIIIAPSLSHYYYTYTPVASGGNLHQIGFLDSDGTFRQASYTGVGTFGVDYTADDVVDDAISDLSAATGVTLTDQGGTMKAEPTNEAYPIPESGGLTGWTRTAPTAVSFGGLDVDFIGNIAETITL